MSKNPRSGKGCEDLSTQMSTTELHRLALNDKLAGQLSPHLKFDFCRVCKKRFLNRREYIIQGKHGHWGNQRIEVLSCPNHIEQNQFVILYCETMDRPISDNIPGWVRRGVGY